MPHGDGTVRIGLGKNVHGVLIVEYEPALVSAHETGHTHKNASSNAHGHGGLNGQSAPASVTYRIAHMARVVRDMTRDIDKDTHSTRTFDDTLLDTGSVLKCEQHDDEVSPHDAAWTSGGEGQRSAVGKRDSTEQNLHGVVEDNATKGNGGVAANGLPAAGVTVSEEIEDDSARSKVGYATKGVRMADLTYKELKDMTKDQPAPIKGHDITCSRMCKVELIPSDATSANGQRGAGATLTQADLSRYAAQPDIT
ncbi:unnamed protein product [Closterium sp. NIES-53]